MKRLYVYTFVLVSLVSLFSFIIGFSVTKTKFEVESSDKNLNNSGEVLANWVSTEVKVEELVGSSDLIVRARVVSQDTRLLEQNLPVYTAAGSDSTTPLEEVGPSSRANQVGERKVITPFTDSTMEVIEVYKGFAEGSITVMQTGGEIPSENENSPTQKMSTQGDPLFTVGSEHILFLVDISGDDIHAENRILYRIASPAGRYSIQGERVSTTINPQELSNEPVLLPTTIDELINEIKQHVNNP